MNEFPETVNMRLDAREMGVKELLERLKEILASKHGCSVDIEVLVKASADVKKISAFAAMSGCTTEIDRRDDYYIMHLKGMVCCA